MRASHARGFTLIEIVLTVAAMTIISMAVMTSSLLLLRANDLDLAIAATTQNFRAAQLRARANQNDSPWGVFLGNGGITLFRGSSFASRSSTDDETTELSPAIAPSGVTEVVYAKNSGLPNNSGTLTLTHDVLGPKQLTINGLGLIDEVQP